MFDVVVIGSLNLDLVARCSRLPGPGETVLGSDFTQVPGGKGLNQAVAAARSGATVTLVGAVGDDDAGRLLRQVMIDEGIDDRWLHVVGNTPTGRALIAVDDSAENSIVVVPGANTWDDPAAEPPPLGRVVLAQLEVPLGRVERAFAAARSVGASTVLNPAPVSQLGPALLSNCDYLVPNEHEADLLGGFEALLASGVSTIVVTQGAAGVTTLTGETTASHAAFEVQPVDTTGAGDAFCGALSARLATGESFEAAVRFAMAAGALATTKPGAVPSLPHRSDVERLLTLW